MQEKVPETIADQHEKAAATALPSDDDDNFLEDQDKPTVKGTAEREARAAAAPLPSSDSEAEQEEDEESESQSRTSDSGPSRAQRAGLGDVSDSTGEEVQSRAPLGPLSGGRRLDFDGDAASESSSEVTSREPLGEPPSTAQAKSQHITATKQSLYAKPEAAAVTFGASAGASQSAARAAGQQQSAPSIFGSSTGMGFGSLGAVTVSTGAFGFASTSAAMPGSAPAFLSSPSAASTAAFGAGTAFAQFPSGTPVSAPAVGGIPSIFGSAASTFGSTASGHAVEDTSATTQMTSVRTDASPPDHLFR